MTTSLVTINIPPLQPQASDLTDDDLIYLRGWYTRSFVAGDGLTPVEGGDGQNGFYYNIQCSLDINGRIAIPGFTVQATTLSNPTASFIAQLWINNAPGQVVIPNTTSAGGWQIPTVYGSTIAFDELATYNRAKRLTYAPDTYFTADETIAEIRRLAGDQQVSAVGVLGIIECYDGPDDAAHPKAVNPNSYATTSHRGIGFSSVDVSPASDVTFVETTDTRMPAQTEADALVGSYGTPSSSNRYVTETDPLIGRVETITIPCSGNGSLLTGKPIKISSGLAVAATTSDTSGIVGIGAGGVVGTAYVAVGGALAFAIFDGNFISSDVGLYVVNSSTLNGTLHAQSDYPTNTQPLGRVIDVVPFDIYGTVDVFGTEVKAESPLTTKGDLFGFSTVNARFPVGTNGKVVTADSTQALGVKYKFGPAGTTFNVKDYGATGDGSTDDTSAINSAIAAYNSAGGILYFPVGTYKVTGALTPLTKQGIVRGDGGQKYISGVTPVASPASVINCTSATAVLFTLDYATGSGGTTIEDICFANTAGSTPSAGSGIFINVYGGWFCHLNRITVEGFYDCVDVHDGDSPTITNSFISDPVRYGIRLRNVLSADSGDQGLMNNTFIAYSHTSTAAVQYESGGGLRFIGNKINTHDGTGKFTVGLNATFGSGIHTADLVVTGNSFENTVNEGIKIVTTSDGTFKQIVINGNQLAPTNTTAPAITIAAGTYPNISRISIGDNVFSAGDAAYPAIQLTNVDGAKVPFNANYYTGYGGLLKSLTSTDVDILYIYTKSDQSGCVIDPYNYQTAARKGMDVLGNPLVHYDNGVAFASLPTVPASTYAYTVVTDSNTATWGANIAGGGSNKVLAFWNGSNWTVAAK